MKSTNTHLQQPLESLQTDNHTLRGQADEVQNKNKAYAVDVAKIRTAVEALLNVERGEVGTLPRDDPIRKKLSNIDRELRKLIEE